MTNDLNHYPFDLQNVLTYRFARLQAKLNAQASDLVDKQGGISLSQWRILAVLSDQNISTQKDVLMTVGLDKGQISRTIKQLVQKQFITVSHDQPDSRIQHLALTEAGIAITETLHPIMNARQKYLQQDFTDEEIEQLFEWLGRLEGRSHKLNFGDNFDG